MAVPTRLELLDSTGYAGLQDADTNFSNIWAYLTEIENARDGESTLLAKQDAQDDLIDALAAGNIAYSIEAKTTGWTLDATDLAGHKIFTNYNADGSVTATLPAGSSNKKVAFYVATAQTFKIQADGAEKIRFLAQQTAGGGYLQSATVGDYIEIMWDTGNGEWVVTKIIGVWTHAGGTFFVGLDEYCWQYINAGAMFAPTTNGAAPGTKHGTNRSFDYFAFDGGATEEIVYATLMPPPGWDRSTVKAKGHWSPGAATCSENDYVTLAFALGAVSDDDTWDAALGTYRGVQDQVTAGKDADLHTTAATPAITCGGTPALNDEVTLGIKRDTDGSLETTSDDMAEDLWLRGCWIGWKITNTVSDLS